MIFIFFPFLEDITERKKRIFHLFPVEWMIFQAFAFAILAATLAS
jgi:hypothetical protein